MSNYTNTKEIFLQLMIETSKSVRFGFVHVKQYYVLDWLLALNSHTSGGTGTWAREQWDDILWCNQDMKR